MKTNRFPKDKPMPVTSRIGDVIRKRREALGLSQEELARLAGLTTLCVHLIETHQRYPKMDTPERGPPGTVRQAACLFFPIP